MFFGRHGAYAYDDLMFGRGSEEGAFGSPFYKTCNRCGETGLRWGNFGKGYVLVNQRLIQHRCNDTAGPDEFEDCATSTTQPADGA